VADLANAAQARPQLPTPTGFGSFGRLVRYRQTRRWAEAVRFQKSQFAAAVWRFRADALADDSDTDDSGCGFEHDSDYLEYDSDGDLITTPPE
jgi:hypothetical protein